MTLKEVMIVYLDLEKIEENKRNEIINDLMEVSIEKALDSVVSKMSSEDLKQIGDFQKGSEKFQNLSQKYSLPEIFLNVFNKQLKETLNDFRTRSRKAIDGE